MDDSVQKQSSENGLIELIMRGGILSNVPGASPQEVIIRIIDAIHHSPVIDRKQLLDAVMEREALMSTAVGCGIALPHPRNPLVTESTDQFVTIAFLEQPVNWNSLDRIPVHTAILIVSASPRLHLHTLSRINFFCQQENFRFLLASRASSDEIIAAIRTAEQTWK
jgi:PTS system nitrogen regulatory IIA component